MKIICVGENPPRVGGDAGTRPSPPTVFLKPDTSLLRDNAPFYVPDWAGRFGCAATLAVRISRIGRHIGEQFAHRYYDAAGLCVDFAATDLLDAQRVQGAPWAVARAFDYSTAVSTMVPLGELPPLGELGFSLSVDGALRQEYVAGQMSHSVDAMVAYVSQFFSLRMGDLILLGAPAGFCPIAEGNRLTARMGGRTMLDFLVK